MEIRPWEEDSSYILVPYSVIKGKHQRELIKIGQKFSFNGRALHDEIYGKEFPPDKVFYRQRAPRKFRIPPEDLLFLTGAQMAAKYSINPKTASAQKCRLKARIARNDSASLPVVPPRADPWHSPSLSSLPSPPPLPVVQEVSFHLQDRASALSTVAAHAPSACLSLHLLHHAQEEVAADRARLPGVPLPSLVRRLASLPLCVLERCVRHLGAVERQVEAVQVRPAAARAAEAHDGLTAARQRALLYHICLWQRTYPLDVVTCALELYRAQPHLFPPLGKPLLRQLHDMLADLAVATCPAWAALPWLPRCDVLLTFPQLPAPEQLQLAWASGAGAAVLDGPYRGAAPELLLRDYLPAADIPPRYTEELEEGTYRALRRAFERHKVDGVRRLLRREYEQRKESRAAAEGEG